MTMTTKEQKLHQLLEKVQDLCLSDENFFATGWEPDGRHKWVAWIIIKPGRRPVVFDSGLPNGGGFDLDQLAEPRIDRLLHLTWRCPKPVSTLDKFARAASGESDSGLNCDDCIINARHNDVKDDDLKTGSVELMVYRSLAGTGSTDDGAWSDNVAALAHDRGSKHD